MTTRLNWDTFANSTLVLGRRGENLTRRIEVDVRSEKAQHPRAKCVLNAKNAAGEVYPAAVQEMNGTLVWPVTAGDTAHAGVGLAELALLGEDGEVLKSALAVTMVHESLAAQGDAPESVQSWLDEAYRVLEELKEGGASLAGAVRYDEAQELTEDEKATARRNIGAGTGSGDGGGDLPPVTSDDNGKVLTVQGGAWVAAELPKYDGTYEVTPLAGEQTTLLTAQKYMDSDVTVKQIPYYETSNQSGNTVYIGTEVEIYGD